MSYLTHRILATVTLAILSTAFVRAAEQEHTTAGATPAFTSAIAVLVAGNNSGVSGTVKFTQQADGLRVEADVKGLTPGIHGFHVHEKGDLSKPDLTSAGGHFNPEGHKHAGRMDSERHVGDLGNLEADASGHATVSFVDRQLQLSGPHSIIGRAVIIHGKADDLKSQPAGDAGPRIAGGVIGLVQ
jgi:superoxide dismutase, Cu-Zn family